MKRIVIAAALWVWTCAAFAQGVVPTIPFAAANPVAIYSGQQTATATAAALPSQTLVNGIIITAKSTNSGTVYIGASGETASTGYPLAAGQSISYAVTNLSAIYILDSVTTDAVSFTGN